MVHNTQVNHCGDRECHETTLNLNSQSDSRPKHYPFLIFVIFLLSYDVFCAKKNKQNNSNSNNRLFTVVYFSVRSSRSRALRYGLPILHECQNYLGGGGGLGESEKNRLALPPPASHNPRRSPPRYILKSR